MVRDTTIASGRGPVAVHLPDGIDDVQKFARLPLVVYLHGYGGTADGFDQQFGLHAGHIDKNNMIVLMPDGRRFVGGFKDGNARIVDHGLVPQ